ncbi:hypothetical protein [Rappaport israeli]|uniref:hypothetical protein n=1 Tax=Rappaport israeli TaxID=1839807 RepID=UPI00130123D9|nr:hypothetical protein [Rappaport israeli]
MICIPYFSATILINTELLKTADDRRIVRPIIFISTMGSILFALVIMAQMTLDDSNTINVFRWLFGLYILAISWPFAQMLKRSIDYLDEYYQDFLSYRILRIVIAILPLSTAIFGIASVSGYLNFAWVSTRYILYFVLFAILWVSIIALLKDASLWAKRYALQNTQNGLFWAQDVITPYIPYCATAASSFSPPYFLNSITGTTKPPSFKTPSTSSTPHSFKAKKKANSHYATSSLWDYYFILSFALAVGFVLLATAGFIAKY